MRKPFDVPLHLAPGLSDILHNITTFEDFAKQDEAIIINLRRTQSWVYNPVTKQAAPLRYVALRNPTLDLYMKETVKTKTIGRLKQHVKRWTIPTDAVDQAVYDEGVSIVTNLCRRIGAPPRLDFNVEVLRMTENEIFESQPVSTTTNVEQNQKIELETFSQIKQAIRMLSNDKIKELQHWLIDLL